jgi:hypothetical protein
MVGRWLSGLALGLIIVIGPASALDRNEIRSAMEQVQTHRRVALGYLQTGNADLALIEMERLRDSLKPQGAESRWSEPDPALAAVLSGAGTTIEQGIQVAEGGDLDRAGALIVEANAALEAWRRNTGLRLFSDCIATASRVYEVLDTHRRNRPDLSDPDVRRHIVEAAAATERALARCDSEAPPDVRTEPEFRRLMNGFAASLKLVPEAADNQDGDYLHRLLIEQRAFDRLLAFRFG